MYWNGIGFESFSESFGAMGPDGQTCAITIGTVDTVPAGSPLEVTLTGTAPTLTLNLKVPRGVKGRKGEAGPPGPIRQASDYADGTHSDRMVPMWDAVAGKWTPRPFPGLRGPWSIIENRAWDSGTGFAPTQTNIGTSPNTIAQLNIPAQDTAWRPVVSGGVLIRTTEPVESFTTRVDAEVRIGSASGQIVALGAGLAFGLDSFTRFQPYYATSVLTPSSSVGVVPKDQPVTLFVVLRRNQGDSNYTYTMPGANITCWAQPVVTP
ncbi:hypothetical protein [Nocardia sp. NPDC057668]|uniref:hypothetical protein n=1 Tax=Nocardia sp. NPDC057668 TaxID=3346202 RepID=UPI00366E6315